jgi:hypothetical protein
VVLDGLRDKLRTVDCGVRLVRRVRPSGNPRVAITSVEVIERPTSSARHSRVYSSSAGIHFSRRLSSVASKRKS